MSTLHRFMGQLNNWELLSRLPCVMSAPCDSLWKTLRIRGLDFEECVAVHSAPGLWGGEVAWQVQPFHNHLHRQMAFCRWYDARGTRHNNGKAQVEAWSYKCCPGLVSECVRSARSVAGKATWQARKKSPSEPPSSRESCGPKGLFSDMCSTAWLLIYLLRPALCPRRAWAKMAKRSLQLLQLLCALATEEEVRYTTALSGEVVLSHGRVEMSGQKTSSLAGRLLDTWREDTTTKLGMVLDPSCIAGWLWCLCAVVGKHSEDGAEACVIMRETLSDALAQVSMALQAWAWRKAEAQPIEAMATAQPQLHGVKRRRREVPPLVRKFFAGRRRSRVSMQELGSAGNSFPSSGRVTEESACSKYAHAVMLAFEGVTTLEINLDASRVSGRNIEVLAIYNPNRNLGAYLPPQVIPELDEEPQDVVVPGAVSWTDTTSLRTRPGRTVLKWLRVLNNALVRGLGVQLGDFQALQTFPPLSKDEVRVSTGSPPRWYRVDPPSGAASAVPEIEDETLEAVASGSLRLLLLTGDQDTAQGSAIHFLLSATPGGMGCFADFREDFFHRSYNDFKWACRWTTPGHLAQTVLQMCFAFNCNYGPYLRAANMGKKQEALLRWRKHAPLPDQEWQCLVDEVVQDGRLRPAVAEGDIDQLYGDGVLHHASFMKKGEFAKHAAWYSVLACMDRHDRVWSAWKYMMRGLSRLLGGRTKSAKEARKIAAQELLDMEQSTRLGNCEEEKAGQRRRLHEIKKRAGNMLLLCPSLLNNFNKFNSRVLLLGARAFWTEQSILAQMKTTPVADKARTVQFCTGQGEKLLKEVWRSVTHDAGELSRLGLETLPGVQLAVVSPEIDPDSGVLQPGVETADIPTRLMSFVCHMLEARFWSYATYQWSWPRAFLALLAEGAFAEEVMITARRQWEACLLAEAQGHRSPGLQELLAQQYWHRQPLVQLGFRLLAHCGFERRPSLATTLFERLATRMGDSKFVEETHKLLRQAETQGQGRNQVAQVRLYHQLTISGTPLEQRGVPVVQGGQHADYEDCGGDKQKPSVPWTCMFGQRVAPLKQSWRCENVLRTPKPYPHPSTMGQRVAIAAGTALRSLVHDVHAPCHAARAWETVTLTPHTLVIGDATSSTAPGDEARVWFVLANGVYAARVIPCKEVSPSCFVVDAGADWSWLTIFDMTKWRHIPTAWDVQRVDSAKHGWFCLQATGPEVPVAVASMCLTAPRRLVANHRKRCLGVYGKQAQGDAAETALVQELLPDPALQEKYLKRLKEGHAEMARRRRARVEARTESATGLGADEGLDEEDYLFQDDEPEDIAAMSLACVEGMDVSNACEFQQEKRRLGGHPAMQHAVKRVRLETAHGAGPQAKLVHPPAEEVPPSTVLDDEGAKSVEQPDRRARTETAWLRPYLPGAEGSCTTLPAETKLAVLNHPRTEWVARYVHPSEEQADAGPLGKKTRTRKHRVDDEGVSSHQKFQEVLKWLWDKHRWCTSVATAEAMPLPAHVEVALAPCEFCESGACTFIEDLQKAEGRITVAAESGGEECSSSDSSTSSGTSSSSSSAVSGAPRQTIPGKGSTCGAALPTKAPRPPEGSKQSLGAPRFQIATASPGARHPAKQSVQSFGAPRFPTVPGKGGNSGDLARGPKKESPCGAATSMQSLGASRFQNTTASAGAPSPAAGSVESMGKPRFQAFPGKGSTCGAALPTGASCLAEGSRQPTPAQHTTAAPWASCPAQGSAQSLGRPRFQAVPGKGSPCAAALPTGAACPAKASTQPPPAKRTTASPGAPRKADGNAHRAPKQSTHGAGEHEHGQGSTCGAALPTRKKWLEKDGARWRLRSSKVVCVPGDDNCLFSAFMVGVQRVLKGKEDWTAAEAAELGRRTRKVFLGWVTKLLQEDATVGDFSVRRLLCDENDQPGCQPPLVTEASAEAKIRTYVERMSKSSWGGNAELLLLALKAKCRCLLLRRIGQDVREVELIADLGVRGACPRMVCVLWNGAHYDCVLLSESDQAGLLGGRAGRP